MKTIIVPDRFKDKSPIIVTLTADIKIYGKQLGVKIVTEADSDGSFDIRKLCESAHWLAMSVGVTLWKEVPDNLKEMPWEIKGSTKTDRLFLCQDSPFYHVDEI